MLSRRAVQARLHAAVVNIAAHLDAQAADQRRILREGNVQARAVHAARGWPARRPADPAAAARRSRPWRCAGPDPASPAAETATGWRRSRAASGVDHRCTACRTRFSSSKPLTRQLRNSCLASRRACLEIFIYRIDQAASCRLVSSASRCWSSGVRILPVTVAGGLHDQPADFAAQFGQHAGVVLRRRLRAPWR